MKEALTWEEIINRKLTFFDVAIHHDSSLSEEEVDDIYWACYNKVCRECRMINPTNSLLVRELQYGYFKHKHKIK